MPSEHYSQFSILNSPFRRWIRLLFLQLLAALAGPFVRRRKGVIASVLYIKPDHLGDLLLATPVLAALRQRLPDAHMTALVGPWSRMALDRNPDIDALATCPFPGFERRRPDDGAKTKDQRPKLSRILWSLVFGLWSLVRPYLLLLRYALLLR